MIRPPTMKARNASASGMNQTDGFGGKFHSCYAPSCRRALPCKPVIAIARQPIPARRRRQFAAAMAQGVLLMGKDRKDPPTGGGKPASGKADDRSARKAAALRENLRKRKAQQRGREEKPD